MNVLLIGSGGREHALAQSLLAAPSVTALSVAPGNTGTAGINVAVDVDDTGALIAYCQTNAIGLVVVGPEAPLVGGLADELAAAGIACFGPTAAAARLEGSKSFARGFADRHGIPGPRNRTFSDIEAAVAWLDEIGVPVVVKADGLAAGKGVIIPNSRVETERAIYELLAEGSLGEAGSTIVLEERLEGQELSLFGIISGERVDPIGGLTAQDHKRVGDGDTGPNTGGMGAFAPVPGLNSAFVEQLCESFLQPAARGMVAEGTPYVGVLYAGIMLTTDGPRLIEYNCRFGDPEAQVIVPLITSDLGEVFVAAATGKDWADVRVKANTTAATVVVAADGYPNAPQLGIAIPEIPAASGTTVYHASMKRGDDGALVSAGGRVLSVTGEAADLGAALGKAYEVVNQLTGNGLFARSDIGWRHLDAETDAYSQAGVSLEAGAATTARIAASVKSTHDDRVVAGLGSFGGVFDLSALKDMDCPLMVATTDGVGTKTVLAAEANRWEGVGADIVNHGVNDVLVQNARPLFFLDTVASAALDPEIVGRVVDGMAEACRAADCVLIGGETAEMPGVLTEGAVDISGTLVGVVDRKNLLPTPAIAPGHLLVGLTSSGLHTNGYSLARKVVAGMSLDEALPGGDGESLADALLAVHRNYLPPLEVALDAGLIDGLAHITGGGLIDNIPRILPDGCGAIVNPGSWTIPPLFQFLIDRAGLTMLDACRILNLGIGMVVVVAPERLEELQNAIDEVTFVIGEVNQGSGVRLS